MSNAMGVFLTAVSSPDVLYRGQSLLTSTAIFVQLGPYVPQTGGCAILFDQHSAVFQTFFSQAILSPKVAQCWNFKFAVDSCARITCFIRLQRALFTGATFLSRPITPDREIEHVKVKLLTSRSEWHKSLSLSNPITLDAISLAHEVSTMKLKIANMTRNDLIGCCSKCRQ